MVQEFDNNESMHPNSKGGGYRGLSMAGNVPRYLSSNDLSDFQNSEIAKFKRTRLSPQDGDDNHHEQPSLLGLSLRRTPSLLDLVDQMALSQERQITSSTATNYNSNRCTSKFVSQSSPEKLKASNFSASKLTIGNWQRTSKHEGDLVAKCYFAKRKLVWEFLEGALKYKIELQWSDVVAIRATFNDNEPGVLEIELNQPPLFFRETNPQPRKHTIWQQASDFTTGQASIWRRHYVQFPPGILDKHYEKLLQFDQRLYGLSQEPFPSYQSPYFEAVFSGFSQLYYGLQQYIHRRQFAQQLRLMPSINQVHNINLSTQAEGRIMNSNSPMSVTHCAYLNEKARDHQRMLQGQGLGNVVKESNYLQELPDNIFEGNNAQGLTNIAAEDYVQANSLIPNEDYHMLKNVQKEEPTEDPTMLEFIEKHLMNDPQVNMQYAFQF